MLLLMLAGCSTSSVLREHEVQANLPRAQGLGAFSPACLFFCFTEAHFQHGDDTIDPSATAALMRSKLVIEQEKASGSRPSPSIIRRPKPTPPKEPKP